MALMAQAESKSSAPNVGAAVATALHSFAVSTEPFALRSDESEWHCCTAPRAPMRRSCCSIAGGSCAK